MYSEVSPYSIYIWGIELPYAVVEYVLFHLAKSVDHFSVRIQLLTGINYLDMLQLWLMPQLQENSEDFILQQDIAQPHFPLAHLSSYLPGHWIWHASYNDSSSSLPSMVT